MFKNATGVSLQERNKIFLEYKNLKKDGKSVILKKNNRLYLFNDEANFFKKKYLEAQVFQASDFNSIVLEINTPIDENFNKIKVEIYKDKPEYHIKNDTHLKPTVLNILKQQENKIPIEKRIEITEPIVPKTLKKPDVKLISFSQIILIEESSFENNSEILKEFFNKYKITHTKLNLDVYFKDLQEIFNLNDKNETETLLWNLNFDINNAVLNYYLNKNFDIEQIFTDLQQSNYFIIPDNFLDNHLNIKDNFNYTLLGESNLCETNPCNMNIIQLEDFFEKRSVDKIIKSDKEKASNKNLTNINKDDNINNVFFEHEKNILVDSGIKRSLKNHNKKDILL